MTLNSRGRAGAAAVALGAIAAGCAVAPAVDYDKVAHDMLQASFRAQGQATIDRIEQDEVQRVCSKASPSADDLKRIETAALATIKPPSNGRYLGDWREGEKLAQNGRGMTWTDPAGTPAGGNCYNCHQMSKAEISFGTLGPSLYNYGKLRGVKDPADPSAAPIVQYTWGKIYNAKAFNACSGMPRFGHARVLTEQQMQDLTALLLDPKSPVNE